jgi:hypothetical protein
MRVMAGILMDRGTGSIPRLLGQRLVQPVFEFNKILDI